MGGVSNLFHRVFQVATDYTDRVFDESLRLRYLVYCLETGFENHADFNDRRERDTFDAQSVHGVVRHRDSSVVLGTARLVTTRGPHGPAHLPIQARFPGLFAQHGLGERELPSATTAEISRFAISKTVRENISSELSHVELPEFAKISCTTPDGRAKSRSCPLVTFGLFLALVRLSAQHGIRHWVAVMEPSLLRLLARFGIQFTPIGGLVRYHGWRQPCYGSVASVLTGIYETTFELWQLITDNGHGHPQRTARRALRATRPECRWRPTEERAHRRAVNHGSSPLPTSGKRLAHWRRKDSLA